MRRSSTLGREGREKNPSVRTADVPSDTSRLATPRKVTDSPPSAAGTSKRSA
jgi:hypothetical protein